MYPTPQEKETTDTREFVHNKEPAFQRVFETSRRNLNEKNAEKLFTVKVSLPCKQRRRKSFALSFSHRCWNNV